MDEREAMVTRVAASRMAYRWGKQRLVIESALREAKNDGASLIANPTEEEAKRFARWAEGFYPEGRYEVERPAQQGGPWMIRVSYPSEGDEA